MPLLALTRQHQLWAGHAGYGAAGQQQRHSGNGKRGHTSQTGGPEYVTQDE